MNKKISDKAMQLTYSLGMIILIILSIIGFLYLVQTAFIQN
tara:strand:+ start:392 stop:514 length:123 start_codon:yes stop_codon:yes gene_type:complete